MLKDLSLFRRRGRRSDIAGKLHGVGESVRQLLGLLCCEAGPNDWSDRGTFLEDTSRYLRRRCGQDSGREELRKRKHWKEEFHIVVVEVKKQRCGDDWDES